MVECVDAKVIEIEQVCHAARVQRPEFAEGGGCIDESAVEQDEKGVRGLFGDDPGAAPAQPWQEVRRKAIEAWIDVTIHELDQGVSRQVGRLVLEQGGNDLDAGQNHPTERPKNSAPLPFRGLAALPLERARTHDLCLLLVLSASCGAASWARNRSRAVSGCSVSEGPPCR
jgi:hypothetical protein